MRVFEDQVDSRHGGGLSCTELSSAAGVSARIERAEFAFVFLLFSLIHLAVTSFDDNQTRKGNMKTVMQVLCQRKLFKTMNFDEKKRETRIFFKAEGGKRNRLEKVAKRGGFSEAAGTRGLVEVR
jgi:hypothetical protein